METRPTPVQEFFDEIKAKSTGAFGQVTIADVALIAHRMLLKEQQFAEHMFNSGVKSKFNGEDNFLVSYTQYTHNESISSITATNAVPDP